MPAAPYLFVSDLHLAASTPEAVAQFLAFLRREARAARALYILGDLFEAWVGDDDDEPVRAQVCEALRELTAGGVAGFLMSGNRDFLYGEGVRARTGFGLLPDPVKVVLPGAGGDDAGSTGTAKTPSGAMPVFVSHGDVLCTDDHSYQELRSVVRAPLWQQRFLALPLEVRRAVADAARRGSESHTRSTMRAIMDVNEQAVQAAFRLSGTRLMIHGHTHRPGVYRHVVDGEPATRIVLGDWYEQGSCLRVQVDGGFELQAMGRL